MSKDEIDSDEFIAMLTNESDSDVIYSDLIPMINNGIGPDDFITMLEYYKNIDEWDFRYLLRKHCKTFKNKSTIIKFIKLVIDTIVERYALMKIFFDYICKKFDMNKKEIREKSFIDKYFRSDSKICIKHKFNMSLYFYDIDFAIKLLCGYEHQYYDIFKNNPIEEKHHRKILRTKKSTRDYFINAVSHMDFEEIEKCFKYGYRPCKKTFYISLDDYFLRYANMLVKFIDLMIKYNIPLKKISYRIVREAMYKLSVKLLDVCVKYGFDITVEAEPPGYRYEYEYRATNKINFIQKLINIGIDTFEIVDIMERRMNYIGDKNNRLI